MNTSEISSIARTIQPVNLKNLKIGNKYHLHNAWATDMSTPWMNDSVLKATHTENDSNTLLEFEHEYEIFFVDSGLLYEYNKKINFKCYQFIEAKN